MGQVKDKKNRIHAEDRSLDFLSKGKEDAFGILLGVELEYDSLTEIINSDFVSMIQDMKNFIVKDDGSLRGGGYEIVSAPLSLVDHKTSIEWEMIFGMIDVSDITERNRACGLHVHINQSCGIDYKKCRALVYSNPTFFSKRFAKRTSDAWARMNRYISYNPSDMYMFERKPISEDKNQAINADGCEGDTVEIRMFASTKNLIRLYRALEFSHAIARYSREFPLSPQVDPFFKFIRKEASLYPAVYASFMVNGVCSYPSSPEILLSDLDRHQEKQITFF